MCVAQLTTSSRVVAGEEEEQEQEPVLGAAVSGAVSLSFPFHLRCRLDLLKVPVGIDSLVISTIQFYLCSPSFSKVSL